MSSPSRLKSCPSSPNCVSTVASRDDQRMAPLPYSKALDVVLSRIRQVVLEEPRTALVENQGAYLHFTFKSALLGFVDDVEFELDERDKLVHFRSASRIGYSDLGVNRSRMSKLAAKLRPYL
jgi:uncharacterized protein (DUF1499 family)